ncbi:hypothetical protein GCM10007925_15500 [Sphingomonas astaxanthinifaciens DSM 22298]|uniref:Uncharacterized protein n=2 Tax=Sphingomonas TaxID=13687 RepID=A0ABQ5Z782_9SPHN|nr:glycosyltransferase family 4 protein [Sphingomonas astaxanthinifaciens]GLR47837.1 hypothetical protein GCM10007925_15500 [Sphingomonas astaxanthinifaciens DSM 22298]
MRIIYVINSAEGGGAAFPVPRILGTLARLGAEVRLLILTPRDRRALPRFDAAGLDYVLREGGRTDHLHALRWLDREVARWGPNVIWTSLTRATLLGQQVGRRRAIPVVSWQHAAFLKPANLLLLRATQRRSRLWIGDSAAITALTAERLHVPPERLTSWPIFATDPAAPVARPWSPGETLRLGSLGRLHPVKGYDLLVAAMGILRRNGFVAPAPWEVTIGGEGEARSALEQQARAAGIDLHLPGFTAAGEAFLSGLHLYLQPSRGEGFCIAAHEAMQAGLPVIGSAVGEMANSIVDGETGRLVAPDDAEGLATALRDLLSRPERLAAMGQAGRTRVLERFSEPAFEERARAILARLAGFAREGRPEAGGASARSA